ncbi:MAG: hypothetical protein PHY47_06525 [Lachnospiraceae bacterium]|nr:hypothetical protein [Lachnospiraceae bacterium]
MSFLIKNKNLCIDIMNCLLGIIVIVLGALAFQNGATNLLMFPFIFGIGTIMLILNTIRCASSNKLFCMIFGGCSILMAVMVILSLVVFI